VKPFFIYMPLNSPHTPILPSEKWQGKSGISLYADFVMETDDAIGQVMRATEDAGIAQGHADHRDERQRLLPTG
jgi:arylsulfatase A